MRVNQAMKATPLVFISLLIPVVMVASPLTTDQLRSAVSSNDVVWKEPGSSSADSMPLGNGDIGLNIWTEQNGDILFYIAKTDAWAENPKGPTGLAKVGKVRFSMSPALLNGTNGFSQALHLYDGEITISSPQGSVRFWVDANAPVIHVQSSGSQPSTLTVSLDPYRAPASPTVTNQLSPFMQPTFEDLKPDYHAEELKDRLAWCHFNGTTNGLGKPTTPEVVNWGFGALIQGRNMTASGTGTLVSEASEDHEISITVASGKAESDKAWIEQVLHASTASMPMADDRQWQAHISWWHAFWDRSYLFVSGTPEASQVTQGYALQRFVTACAGRGLAGEVQRLTLRRGLAFAQFGEGQGDGTGHHLPRHRRLPDVGRPVLVPEHPRHVLAAAESGGLRHHATPLPDVSGEIRNNEATVKKLYNHEGSYVAETSPHWGALPNLVGKTNGAYTDFYFTPVLELSTMMLDYYDHTQDTAFVKETLLPFANLGLTFSPITFRATPKESFFYTG